VTESAATKKAKKMLLCFFPKPFEPFLLRLGNSLPVKLAEKLLFSAIFMISFIPELI